MRKKNSKIVTGSYVPCEDFDGLMEGENRGASEEAKKPKNFCDITDDCLKFSQISGNWLYEERSFLAGSRLICLKFRIDRVS
jgi:hypothetical protein